MGLKKRRVEGDDDTSVAHAAAPGAAVHGEGDDEGVDATGAHAAAASGYSEVRVSALASCVYSHHPPSCAVL
jgi:hypothetical protein